MSRLRKIAVGVATLVYYTVVIPAAVALVALFVMSLVLAGVLGFIWLLRLVEIL